MSYDRAVGAYGFRLEAAEPGVRLPDLVPVNDAAPKVRISWRQGGVEENRLQADDDSLIIAVRDTVRITIDRATRDVSVVMVAKPTPHAIVHPVSTTALAALARLRGDPTLHAGAVLLDDAAYGVFGPQRAGKSTTLALFARRGFPVVADDLLVFNGTRVFAGPSCIDLRADVATRFPEAVPLGIIGARERFRLPTTPAPPAVPLAGLFLLDWQTSPGVSVSPVSTAERLRLIHSLDYAGFLGLPRPGGLLDLLALPMWRCTRAPGLESSEELLERMIAAAA